MNDPILNEQPNPRINLQTELLPLPISEGLLPTQAPALITSALWRRVAGSDALRPGDQRVDELCFYIVFAALGFIGYDRDKTENVQTMLVPVAFETGTFPLRLTVFHLRAGGSLMIVSLPEESIPLP